MAKRKRRDYNDDKKCLFLSGFCQQMLFLIRRRHRLFPLVSVSVTFACFLLFFVSFCLLSTPPILHQPHLRHHFTLNNVAAARSNLDAKAVIPVPENGGNIGRDLWSSSLSKFYCGCSNASDKFQLADEKTHHNRYLLIATSGGLNQQRTGIIDAVVAAYILNATLVVPKLDQKSYWKDSSNFDQIFNVNQFISFLSKDVKIIKELPTKEGKVITPYAMRVPRKCTPKCYHNRVLPVLNKKHIVQLSKFDYRLSNRLDTDLQKLRCRVNYHALEFTDSIHEMGKQLVERMRVKAKHFIALHLRFEPDMLAFSGCYYGGGEKERTELGAIRKRWKTLHKPNPDKVRRHGRCPLTPEEIGLMLRALGYGSDVHLYVASGEVYGGDETLAPLKELFPNFHTKDTIANQEELAPFLSFSSRKAALDFIVCDESDVFITNNNGNMARILAGRRRYFGHKPTIRPNAKKLYKLFLNRSDMTWEEFSSRVRAHQIGFMGEANEVKPGRGEFHENPSACICEDFQAKTKALVDLIHEHDSENEPKNDKESIKKEDTGDSTDKQVSDYEEDWFDIEYGGDEIGLPGGSKEPSNGTYSDISFLGKPDQPEVDEFFSD